MKSKCMGFFNTSVHTSYFNRARQPQIRSLSWVPRKFSLKAEIPKSATTPRMVHMDTLQRKGIGPTLRTWGKMMIPNPVPHHETLFSAAFIMEVNSLRLAKEKQRQDDDAAAELDRAILEKEAHDSKLLQERSRAEKAKRALVGGFLVLLSFQFYTITHILTF